MKGTIKTYLPEKQYGFIKGDDGKDYFFHENEFINKQEITNICEEAFVKFDQQATPKGYKAKMCMLLEATEVSTYVTPSEFLTSKNNKIKGWDVIEVGQWLVHGSSRDSPEHAKKEVQSRAKNLGANAVLELTYYKTTGSEPGTGKGTYYFTIHNFHGRITVLAKRNSQGKLKENNLLGVNRKAERMKSLYDDENSSNKKRDIYVWISSALLILGCYHLTEFLTFILVSVVIIPITFIFGRTAIEGDWLVRC